MPYKFDTDKLKIPEKYDKRIKLTDKEREHIKELYGKISQRKLARQFNVSRRLIIFIGDPEKHKRNLEAREQRGGWEQYYKKEEHTEAIRKHMRYKKTLYDKGVLRK